MMDESQKKDLIADTKELVKFNDKEDGPVLAEVGKILVPEGPKLSDYFYDHLMNTKSTKKVMEEEGRLERQKKTLAQWFEDLFTGPYDESYANKMLSVGYLHVKVKVEQRHVTAMYAKVQEFCCSVINEKVEDNALAEKYNRAIAKILAFNMALMSEAYLDGVVDAAGWSTQLLKNMASTSGD